MFRWFLKAGLRWAALFMVIVMLARLTGGLVFRGGVLAFAAPVDVKAASLNWEIVLFDLARGVMMRPYQFERRSPSTLHWSPDGSAVAVITGGNDTSQNHIVKITGRGADLLLPDNAASIGSLSWSPDGKQLAFMMSGSGRKWDIFVMESNGQNLRRLTTNQEGDLHPAWSPDGSRIAFNSERDSSLYVINTDGTNEQRLALSGNRDRSPAWSPDGSRIAFLTYIHTPEKTGSYVAVMNADGSEVSVLAPDGPSIQGFPSWSPDGHHLAFVGSEHNRDAIYAVDMQRGGQPRKLVDNVYYIYHERWDLWSPDGREMVFSQASIPVSGKQTIPTDGLYLVEVATGNIRKIADIAAAFPVWQP